MEAYKQLIVLRKIKEHIYLKKRSGLAENELEGVLERNIDKLCSGQDVFDGGKL